MDEDQWSKVLTNPLVSTPTLVLDFHSISRQYYRFANAFPGASIFYAMKANADPQVNSLVVASGGGLEIASLAELERALEAGAAGHAIICSNPIKSPALLKRMQAVGVYASVVDSTYEVDKLAKAAPGSRVYVRLAVDNTGSVLPLDGKFGVDGAQALMLMDRARKLGLRPIGLSFHVGSQCLSPENWANAIRACGDVWRAGQKRGHDLYFLDIGGGYPAGHYHNPAIPTLESIGAIVTEAVQAHIPTCPGFMLALEPGRGLVGEAGRLVASVEGKAQRGSETWLYLDAGVFNGLMETYEGFPPVVRLLAKNAARRPLKRYTLAGPSCDSCDVIARDVELPEVRIGDRLAFLDAGAYTNEYAAAFNGFPIPEMVRLNAHEPLFEAVYARTADYSTEYSVVPV